jgi:preprotein translocase subunit YajC
MVAALKEGDEIITAGGMLGKITGVSDHYVVVKVSENTEIKMQKTSVAQIVPKDTVDAA